MSEQRHADALERLVTPTASGTVQAVPEKPNRSATSEKQDLLPNERGSPAEASDLVITVETRRVEELEKLVPLVEQAQRFAERWADSYRAEIFRVAFETLRGDTQTTARSNPAHSKVANRPSSAPLGEASTMHGANEAIDKLARALNASSGDIARAVSVSDDGKVRILGRLDGKTKKELQTNYALVLLYVKEIGQGVRMVEIEELRTLCIEQGCYDQGNFTANFKKDVDGGLLREQGEKGARTRRYLLSQRGLSAAAQLLKQVVSE